MTDYPKVSVVTITYGHENYITQTLDGVLMQDYPGEIEFIIANDNSPDQTDEIINTYFSGKNLSRNITIKYTKHSVNKKAMLNLIWAMEQSTGKYIAFCEGDDYWTDKYKLQKQVNFLKNNVDYSVCFTSRKVIDLNNELTATDLMRERDWDLDDIFDGVIFHFQTVVGVNDKKIVPFLKNFIDSYGADTKLSFFYSIMGKVKSLSDVTATYRHNGLGIWSQKSCMERMSIHISESLVFYRKITDSYLYDSFTYQELKTRLYKKIIKQRFLEFKKNEKSLYPTFQLFYLHKPPFAAVFLAFYEIVKEYLRVRFNKV